MDHGEPQKEREGRTVSERQLLPKSWVQDAPDDDPDPPATGPPPHVPSFL